MAAAYGSPLALWIGGARGQAAQVATRGILAFWFGGVAPSSSGASGGVRSLFAPWAGGASSATDAAQVAFRGAPWFLPLSAHPSQAETAAGGIDHRYFRHSKSAKRWRETLSAEIAERVASQPAEVIAGVEALAQKEQITTRRQVAARIEPIAAPDAALIDLYFEFLTLRLQREEEAAIAACIAALV